MNLRSLFPRKDRRLGVANEKRRYDLPLNKGVGTEFLVLLIALMTFLAVMAMASSFALGSITARWSSGLENKLTIEIPAEKADGSIRTPGDIFELNDKAGKALKALPSVQSFEIMDEKQIQDLVAPWMGKEIILQDIPLPGLISVELKESGDEVLKNLEQRMASIDETIRIDTHESWLGSLLRLTGALQFAAGLVALIIGVTTVTAISGAVRTRMAIHHEEIELLHLMGATDSYIMRQLQRHALLIGLKGSLAGLAAGLFVLALIGLISGDTAAQLLPDFHFSLLHIITLVAIPALACLIAAATARFTVLRALSMMP